MKLLIYGYGNPGRQDDGLGIFFSEALEKWAAAEGLKGIDFDSNYQLNAEDALSASEHDAVIFADAASSREAPFNFTEIKPAGSITFTTHTMSPESLLALCAELYDKNPKAYLMAMKGYKWDINEKMTEEAAQNLAKALVYIKPVIGKLLKTGDI